MNVLNCPQIKEKAYVEELENGLKVIIIPKKELNKKYVIWGTNFGSIDNRFINPENGEEINVPDGVAHFLEHKMFEQPDGSNSLDVLMSLGLDANAYTTNDHTAFLFECSEDENFYKGLDELMNYVQSPYYTEKNVEKERGIIGQEIMMYNDDPGFQLYLNTLKCLYSKCAIRLDIAGSIESINKITPDILFKCYNTFYNPSNMVLVLCGNFVEDDILDEVKKRLKPVKRNNKIERIYENEPCEVNQKYMENIMSVSMPIFMIGIKDKVVNSSDRAKRNIAIDILLDILTGKSSELYRELYNKQILVDDPDSEYEFSKQYAHVLISGQSNNPQIVNEMFKEQVKKLKNEGLNSEDFERCKRKAYGEFVMEFNSVEDISKMFLANTIKEVNSFDYVNKYKDVTKEYTEQILKDLFNEDKMVLSIIKGKK